MTMYDTITPTEEHIPMLKSLWKTVFGDTDQQIHDFFATAYTGNRCRCIVDNGKICSVAYWLDCSYPAGRLAYLYAVATAPAYRNQGLCHQLLNNIHLLLNKRRYAGSVLVPAEKLDGFYRSLGYEFFGGNSEFHCHAGTPIPLVSIDAVRYAALRNKYLPRWGVTQDGENLAYLQTQADFYTGDNFLLAATKENHTLTGLELLGNRQIAPGILATLGCSQGKFRCPGENNFAMFRPIDSVPPPSYLGFSFD